MRQPTLFDSHGRSTVDAEKIILYALGDFQSRGKILAARDLPLDRLRGAFKRAAEVFGVDELTDEQAVNILGALGAVVRRVPAFVAKHPYRVVVPDELAARARLLYGEIIAQDA
ncbi:MAG TPA: hypothetical protein VGB17_00850 [Pyrinomonadaceae bacterium]|jgi:hypothetical protein